MGLDSSLYKRSKDIKIKIANALTGEYDSEEVGYWRKFYKLNDLFLSYATPEQYEENDGDLNCVNIMLSKEDLKSAIETIKDVIQTGNFAKDEYYGIEAWEKAIVTIQEIIDNTNFEKEEIFFHAWW